MSVIFFFENVKNLNLIPKMKKKNEGNVFLSEIILSQLVQLNCLY